MIKEAIIKIVDKQDLTYDEAYTVMHEIMSGETSPTQNAAFLAALSTKSTKAETIEEIAGCAAAMREYALAVDAGDMDTFEIVGTGGDGSGSFNISTTSAFVAAAGGVKVSKHGNRAASSKSGTGRLPGGPGGQYFPGTGAVSEAAGSGGILFFLCPEISYIHEICGEYPQRTGIPDGI